MKKKNKVIVFCILLITMLLCCNNVFATTISSKFGGDTAPEGADTVRNIIGEILNATRIVGTGVALVILMAIACKYMVASAGDRADIKKNAIPYVIGAVVLVAASGIIGILQNFVSTI